MSQFDKDLQPGDLIMSYYKGWHIVDHVERRWHQEYDYVSGTHIQTKERSSLIHFRTFMRANYKLVKSKRLKQCDSIYCKKFDGNMLITEQDTLINEILTGYVHLLQVVQP